MIISDRAERKVLIDKALYIGSTGIFNWDGREMLKLSENPPILYPEYETIEQIQGQWWVAKTKSRNEKALAQALMSMAIPYFLPLRQKVYRRKGRVLKSMIPLFSGYMFFSGDSDIRYKTLTTNRIANVIEVIDQNKLIKELTGIHLALKSGLPVDNHPYLKKGVRCRVIEGALRGQEGIIEKRKNVSRIILQIDILGQAAAVDIDADMLEPIS